MNDECIGRWLLSRDLQVLACLIMELTMTARMRTLKQQTLKARYIHAQKVARSHRKEIIRQVEKIDKFKIVRLELFFTFFK